MGRRRVVRGLVVFVVAATFASSWHQELFLLVVAIPAAAITLAVQERLADRSDARRAAALALTAPTGIVDAAAVERIVAADLAAAPWTMPRRSTVPRRSPSARWRIRGNGPSPANAWRQPGRWLPDPPPPMSRSHTHSAPHGSGGRPSSPASRALSSPSGRSQGVAGSLRSVLFRVRPRLQRVSPLRAPARAARASGGHRTGGGPSGRSRRGRRRRRRRRRRHRRVAEGRPRVLRRARRAVAASSHPERAVARRRLDAIGISDGRISRLDRDIACCAVLAAALVASLEAP